MRCAHCVFLEHPMSSILRRFVSLVPAVSVFLVGLAGLGPSRAGAWDYEGHRLVALLALRTLPTNFPAFVQSPAATERVAFLSGEPDRWRNSPDAIFGHVHKPDHFFDYDELPLYGIDPAALSPFRHEATAQFAAARAANPKQFRPSDPARDPDLTRGRIGYLPWTMAEHQGRLKSGFSYLRVFEEAGSPEERLNAEQNIIYMMGVMAHYVGDAVQPLHTTRHFNGWVGDNPEGYTSNRTFHSWIDGGFPGRLGLEVEPLAARLRPARRLALDEPGASRTNVFPALLKFIERQHSQVEPLYRLDRDGRLSGRGVPPAEGRAFIERQMIEGAQLLGDMWVTAWQDAPPDFFLKAQLAKRKLNQSPKGAKAADAAETPAP